MEKSTSSPAAIPANHSRPQATSAAKLILVTSGRTCAESSKKPDPLGSCVKMLMDTLGRDSIRCAKKWKRTATPSGRCLFRLLVSVRDTAGTESGFLPTAKASDGDKGTRTKEGAMREFKRGKNRDLGMFSIVYGGNRLKPYSVERLMGYPTGWTACADSETPSCRKSLRKSSDA